MKAFDNSTVPGNEKAIRKGQQVPPDAANIAFYKSPEFSPEENLVIVDTSQINENSVQASGGGCKLFYANENGVLVDGENNVAVADPDAAVTDEFLSEEDFSLNVGSEYTRDDILPFEHRSRYFHLEKAGFSFAGLATRYDSESVKVLDKNGQEYDKYKIRLIPAVVPGYSLEGDNWAYRVLVYIDNKDLEDLYLQYNKVEIVDGDITSPPVLGHREILNPRHFFKKVPEEADVVDPASIRKKIFAAKPIASDAVDIGRSNQVGADGYKMFVPKKAVSDPRVYQTFRWRINADFIQDRVTDAGIDVQTLKCGVLKMSTDTSTACDYAFMNLSKSRFNASGVEFINPLASGTNKENSAYWHVNIDQDDLSEFDILIWAPKNKDKDVTPFLPKIYSFAKVHGGTLFFDTSSKVDLWKTLGGILSKPVMPWSGANYTSNSTVSGSQDLAGITLNPDSELAYGNSALGGWDLDEVEHLTHYTFPDSTRYAQFFNLDPSDAVPAVSANGKTLVAQRKIGEGNVIISTLGGLHTASALFSTYDNSKLMSSGNPLGYTNYTQHINGEGVEGAYKMLYNAALLSAKSRALDSADESSFSSSWRFSTDWRASWVINAFDRVLTDREKQENNFAVDAVDPDNGDFTPVWKRTLAPKTIEQIVRKELATALKDDVTLKDRVSESRVIYSIQVTNPKVNTGDSVNGEDLPRAWTTAYSPKFTVPDELAPYVVKNARDQDGKQGIKADFGPVEYSVKDYPDTPYGGRVRILNATSEELITPVTTQYTVTGTALGTKTVETQNPDVTTQVPVTSSSTVVKELSWAAAHNTSAAGKGDPLNPGTKFQVSNFPAGFVRPYGIRTWQDYNYTSSSFGNGNLLWPYMGFQSRLNTGSSGNNVKFIQTALNRFKAAGYLSISRLTVDGAYGPATKSAVRTFQTTIGARYVDGVIDAETWWLTFAWIQRLYRDGKHVDNYLNLFDNYKYISQHRLSDGTNAAYGKRSWTSNGPSVVWDLVAITFDQQYKMEGVTIIPDGIGNTSDIMFRAVHVKNGNSLRNFSAETCFMKNMNHRPKVGEKFTLPFAQRTGDTLIVGIGQDKPYKSGQTARYLGLKDVRPLVRISQTDTSYQTVVEDGGTSVTEYEEEFTFEYTDSVTVTATQDAVVSLEYPGGDGYINVSNITFDSLQVSNPEVLASLTSNNTQATFTTNAITTAQGSEVQEGPDIPGGTYYAKTPGGSVDPMPETGMANKSEGVKLLCKADGSPHGFPALPPSTGPELTRHYMTLSIAQRGNGPETYLAFYDANEREFITSATGEAEMPYLEYTSRGPQNIYIAVVSEYEVTEQKILPGDIDAPRLPVKQAMPVYGVCMSKGTEIALEMPPGGLNIRDVWPIAVRPGEFRRAIQLPKRSKGRFTGYLAAYQGTEVRATYSIPEAAVDSGSLTYGPGKADIFGEEPKVLDENTIKIRQYPIYQAEKPVQGTWADPVVPAGPKLTPDDDLFLNVYKRADRSSPWNKLNPEEIKDYNTSTGEIFLRDKLTSLDPTLLKVDYTSEQPFYSMTRTRSGQLVNLNVFLDMMPDYEGKPIYVYMLPHYIYDEAGDVIPESYNEKTLDITSSPDIFDSTSPDYDPLAIQLGVIYTSNSTDIKELALFDTRTRGGGLTAQALADLIQDSTDTYAAHGVWDIEHTGTVSYPKQGYVIVRLPSVVTGYLEHEDVKKAIQRNLTGGVGFDIQDESGNPLFPLS